MSAFIDLSGRTFGRLKVLRRSSNIGRRVAWVCLCGCGKEVVLKAGNLKRGTQSCGCLVLEILRLRATHRMSGTPEHKSWSAMIQRCTNPNEKRYKDYGGRGIKVCQSWRLFENFIRDMGRRPTGTTLDRKDNNGDYCPNNCRWATDEEQANNARSNVLITCAGKTQTLSKWAREVGIDVRAISQRRNLLGWTDYAAIFTPLRACKKRAA